MIISKKLRWQLDSSSSASGKLGAVNIPTLAEKDGLEAACDDDTREDEQTSYN